MELCTEGSPQSATAKPRPEVCLPVRSLVRVTVEAGLMSSTHAATDRHARQCTCTVRIRACTYQWYHTCANVLRTYTWFSVHMCALFQSESCDLINTISTRGPWYTCTNITLSQKRLEIQALGCNGDTSGRCKHRRHHGILHLRFQLDSAVCSVDLHHNPRKHVGPHAHQRRHRLP
jgi:hypothetical protein